MTANTETSGTPNNIELVKLIKDTSWTRRRMAERLLETEAKLRIQITQSNRYFEIIKTRDATIRDLKIQLAVFKGSAGDSGRRSLMGQAAQHAIENKVQTRVREDKIEEYRDGAWAVVPANG